MIVIKAGGNAIWPRGSDGVDKQFMECLFAFVHFTIRTTNEKVVFFPGGVGGQHFITWAREAGCSEAEMNHVGCNLIGMAALILNRYFLSKSGTLFSTCPAVATAVSDLELYSNSYDLVVSGVAVIGGISSDSLAALAAEHLKAKLIIIKNRYPYEAEHLESARDGVRAISLRTLSDHINHADTSFAAGQHASLDPVCLRVLDRSRLNASFISKDDLARWHSGSVLSMLHIEE